MSLTRKDMAANGESESERGNDNAKNNGDSKTDITVSGIFIHPVKSLRPVSVNSTKFSNLGLEGDRTLMVVRPYRSSSTSTSTISGKPLQSHRFLTQRQCPALATIDASLPTVLTQQNNKVVIQLSHGGTTLTTKSDTVEDEGEKKNKVFIDVTPKSLKSYPVRYYAGLWDDVVEVVDVGDDAAAFIQQVIKTYNNNNDDDGDDYDDVRVVSLIPNVTNREADGRYVPSAALNNLGSLPQVALSDGFPILIASEESLNELNGRLAKKGKGSLPMSRFRPNIVVKGLKKGFDEDEWRAIQIGGKSGPIFHIVKGCPRCKQSCTDQVTGELDVEPLETLKEFRALGKNVEDVYFGQNVVLQPTITGLSSSSTSIYVGDQVKILTRGDPIWDMDTVQAE